MRVALIEDGVVTNVALVTDDSWEAPPGVTSVESDTAAPGDLYDGETFTRPSVDETPLVDVNALKLAALGAIGGIDAAAALGGYLTVFSDAVTARNWTVARATVAAARAAGALTREQADTIGLVMTSFGVPS